MWTTHLSGIAWVIGYLVMLPLGLLASCYLQLVASWNLLEVVFAQKSFDVWLERPFRRAVMNGLIFFISVLASLVPIVSIFTQPWLAWWSIADYYDY